MDSRLNYIKLLVVSATRKHAIEWLHRRPFSQLRNFIGQQEINQFSKSSFFPRKRSLNLINGHFVLPLIYGPPHFDIANFIILFSYRVRHFLRINWFYVLPTLCSPPHPPIWSTRSHLIPPRPTLYYYYYWNVGSGVAGIYCDQQTTTTTDNDCEEKDLTPIGFIPSQCHNGHYCWNWKISSLPWTLARSLLSWPSSIHPSVSCPTPHFLLSNAMKVVRNRCPFVFISSTLPIPLLRSPARASLMPHIGPIPVVRFNPTDEQNVSKLPFPELRTRYPFGPS